MQQYTYSIIIPHKNIPDLLQRCLDSIPQRDDVQVVIVDDNSDPDKVDFEHFPGLNRLNTEVYFDKTGRGAGRARNVGLEYAKGEWVTFADCDDYYHTDNLNELFNKVLPASCKLIIWGIQHLNFDGTIWEDFVQNKPTLSKIEDKDIFLGCFAPWRCMVRKKLVSNNNIIFDEIPASNDVMFHTRLMGVVKTDDILWYSKIIYTWEQRKSSITHQPCIKKTKSRFLTSLRANQYAKKQGWRRIDPTHLYLGEIKKMSSWYFFIAFYWECYYLGWKTAADDYNLVCKSNVEKLWFFSHPIIIGQLMKKYICSFIRIYNH